VARRVGDLKLCEVQGPVAEILKATRLDRVLASLGGEDDAVGLMMRS
jgi:anti-anti-sigma regulatory factor